MDENRCYVHIGDEFIATSPPEIDASDMNLFDELEYQCFDLFKLYCKTLGIELSAEPDVDIDFSIAKGIQDKVLDIIEKSGIIINYEPKREKQTISSMDELVAFIEDHDWLVEPTVIGAECHAGFDLYKCSPLGEDFSIVVVHDNDTATLIKEIQECAKSFDEEEHVKMWLEAKENGVSGVPSLKELVQDAEDIQTILDELSDACSDLEIVNDKDIDITDN